MQNETGVAEECILAYLSDGRRLLNDNIRELAGVQDEVRPQILMFSCAVPDLLHSDDICVQQSISRPGYGPGPGACEASRHIATTSGR